jgi:hypothetical protein
MVSNFGKALAEESVCAMAMMVLAIKVANSIIFFTLFFL